MTIKWYNQGDNMQKELLNKKLIIGAIFLSMILIMGKAGSYATQQTPAMTSGSFAIPSSVVSSGGSTEVSSTSFKLYGTIGQPVITSEASTTPFSMFMGFIYTIFGGGGAAPTNLTIEVVANDPQRDVYLFWEGGGKCDVWVHTGPYSGTSEIHDYTGRYVRTYQNISSGQKLYSFNATTDPATQEYFAVAPAGASSNFAETIAGRFDIEVSRDDPTKLFISVPLVMYDSNVQKTLTTQAKSGDKIYILNGDTAAEIGAIYIDNTWYDWATGGPAVLTIDPAQGYAVMLGQQGASTRTFTFAGTISASPEISKTVNKGWQMTGRAYPVGKSINDAGLNGLSSGGPSAKVYEYDSNFSITNNHAAIHIESETWYDWATGTPSSMNLKPGRVYWLYEPNMSDITWEQKP